MRLNVKKSLLVLVVASTCAMAGNPQAVGDVVGRNLGIKGLGFLGHVGMWDGSNVLEVNRGGSCIRKKTLDEFKAPARYWGAKYGKSGNYYRAVAVGWYQRHYSPRYTFSPIWKEGGYVSKRVWNWRKFRFEWKKVKQTAQFRCDTFVNYLSLKASGSKFYNNIFVTPQKLYSSLPKSR